MSSFGARVIVSAFGVGLQRHSLLAEVMGRHPRLLTQTTAKEGREEATGTSSTQILRTSRSWRSKWRSSSIKHRRRHLQLHSSMDSVLQVRANSFFVFFVYSVVLDYLL